MIFLIRKLSSYWKFSGALYGVNADELLPGSVVDINGLVGEVFGVDGDVCCCNDFVK